MYYNKDRDFIVKIKKNCNINLKPDRRKVLKNSLSGIWLIIVLLLAMIIDESMIWLIIPILFFSIIKLLVYARDNWELSIDNQTVQIKHYFRNYHTGISNIINVTRYVSYSNNYDKESIVTPLKENYIEYIRVELLINRRIKVIELPYKYMHKYISSYRKGDMIGYISDDKIDELLTDSFITKNQIEMDKELSNNTDYVTIRDENKNLFISEIIQQETTLNRSDGVKLFVLTMLIIFGALGMLILILFIMEG